MTTKIKLAACLSAEAFDTHVLNVNLSGELSKVAHFLDIGLPDLGLALHDRADCETDPSLLQLLPYCPIINEDNEVLVYDRPATGDESNLHFFSSIGFGGHMDTLRPEDEQNGEVLSVIDNASRELIEEIPFAISEDAAREKIITELEAALHYTDCCMLIRKRVGVDNFHLGLVIPIHMHSSDIAIGRSNPEAQNLRWMSLDELEHVNLESWSRSIVQHKLTPGAVITE